MDNNFLINIEFCSVSVSFLIISLIKEKDFYLFFTPF